MAFLLDLKPQLAPNGSKWLPKSIFFQQLCLSRAPKGVQRSWNIGIFLQTAVLGALLAHAGDLVASFWFNFSRFGFHATFFSIIFCCNRFNLKGLGRGGERNNVSHNSPSNQINWALHLLTGTVRNLLCNLDITYIYIN